MSLPTNQGTVQARDDCLQTSANELIDLADVGRLVTEELPTDESTELRLTRETDIPFGEKFVQDAFGES